MDVTPTSACDVSAIRLPVAAMALQLVPTGSGEQKRGKRKALES